MLIQLNLKCLSLSLKIVSERCSHGVIIYALLKHVLHILCLETIGGAPLVITEVVNVANGLLADLLVGEDGEVIFIKNIGPNITKARHSIEVLFIDVHDDRVICHETIWNLILCETLEVHE